MKHTYRIFFLAILFCGFAKSAGAIGHTVTISHTDVLCFSQCDGTASATVSGGVGPFDYVWTPGNLTTASISSMCAGTYTCTVTDQSDGSTATATVAITQPTQITLNITTNNILCWGGFGSATASVTGGTPAYTFLWTPPGSTSATLNNVPAGFYSLTVTDMNGCVAMSTVTITEPPPLQVAPSAAPDTVCAGQPSILSSNVSGGVGNYNFTWVPGNIPSATPTVAPAVTTTYTVFVTDANGCTVSNIVTVFVDQAIAASISSTDPTCNQSNGSMTINVTQASPPYNLLWSNSQTTPTITNLNAGVYNCTVTDANGCSSVFTAGLSNIGGPTVATSSTNTGCTNYNNGTATVNASGVAPFTYVWNTIPVQNTPVATGLGTGNYLCTVTDSVGCISVAPVVVNATAGNLFMYAQCTAPAVCAQNTGSATTIVQGGTQPYSYLWSNASTSPNLTNAGSGLYSIAVTDANGCTTSGTVNVWSLCANYVEGRVYVDVNQDGVYNSGDIPWSGELVSFFPFSASASTDANGIYRRWVYSTGTVDISLGTPHLFQTASPVGGHHYPVFAMLGDSIDSLDFVLTYNTPFQDLYLNMASGPARPGFVQLYGIHCENRGVTTVSDTIWFQHDSILTLSSANPPFDGYTYPEGYWLFNNFAPGQHINKSVALQVPTIPNGGFIGRQLIANARIEPTASDTSSWDNGDDEVDIITAAYDPNLKECWSPTMDSAGGILQTDLELDYTIHFQNTGTDTAFTVVVVDTLPSELDITTFRMGASSHACTYTIDGWNDTNIVTFTFMNILLPDSNVNEPASHGFCQFAIDRFPNLPIGTQILNEANNYFDFNPAIVTNMDTVTITNPLSMNSSTTSGAFVYPNPAQDNVNILLSNEFAGNNSTVTLRDISGRTISTMQSNGATQLVLNTEDCSAGMYFITIESVNQAIITQQIIISEK